MYSDKLLSWGQCTLFKILILLTPSPELIFLDVLDWITQHYKIWQLLFSKQDPNWSLWFSTLIGNKNLKFLLQVLFLLVFSVEWIISCSCLAINLSFKTCDFINIFINFLWKAFVLLYWSCSNLTDDGLQVFFEGIGSNLSQLEGLHLNFNK